MNAKKLTVGTLVEIEIELLWSGNLSLPGFIAGLAHSLSALPLQDIVKATYVKFVTPVPFRLILSVNTGEIATVYLQRYWP